MFVSVMKKDRHSTGEQVLQQLVHKHALPGTGRAIASWEAAVFFPGLILSHRGLSKILSTYMDPMLQVHEKKRERDEEKDGSEMKKKKQICNRGLCECDFTI